MPFLKKQINPKYHLEYGWKHQGIVYSYSKYLTQLESQSHRCAICGRLDGSERQRLSVDHDHGTGKVRGLLCIRCNRGLGNFLDCPDILIKAARYLECPE